MGNIFHIIYVCKLVLLFAKKVGDRRKRDDIMPTLFIRFLTSGGLDFVCLFAVFFGI